MTPAERARRALMLDGKLFCTSKDMVHESDGALPCKTCDTLVLRIKREIEEAVEEEKKTVRRRNAGRRAGDGGKA